MSAGRLITIEGIDGAGKTTLAAALLDELRGRGIEARLLREPGGVELAERIRALVTEPSLDVRAPAEALLYAAARAQLVQELLVPALAQGQWVVLDRFVDSSLAYQGAARQLGMERIAAVNELATGGLVPDRTLLLEIDPASARARQQERALLPDRLEREDADFFSAVAAGYREIARAEPGRVRVIDASAGPGEVLARAVCAIDDLL